MAFTPEFIAQIRDASDIVRVVGAWVPLKKAGATYKGLCPFHQERTPSFNVTPSRQTFHCFGCGEGGDVFAFVQKREKLDFVEALKLLAERAGIPLPLDGADEAKVREDARRRGEEEAQRRLLELAAAWFRRNLEGGSEGAQALDYARARGLDDATRERFGIGYAPADPAALLSAAKKKGFGEEALAAAGLAGRSERGAYARFRARLMFPIHDPKGRLAGFGGRVLGEGEPKYLNSPEGPLFSKGRLLYPWSQSKDALGRSREALVCEGYMDAIACHQAGLEASVATLGTALTQDHARLLKRYVQRVTLLFDADAAGLRAARRAGEPLLDAGLEVRVARLDGAKDPDELLRRGGPDALRKALDSGRPLVEFCVRAGLDSGTAPIGPSRRAAVLWDVFPLLRRLPSLSEADAALASAAQTVGVSVEAARGDFAAFQRGEERPSLEPVPAPGASVTEAVAPKDLWRVEREFLALLVGHPELVEQAKAELGGSSLCAPELRAAADLLWRAPGGAALQLDDDGSEDFKCGEAVLRDLSQRLFVQAASPEEALKDILERRQELLLKRKADALKLDLRQAGADSAASARILGEFQAVRQAIDELRSERR